MDEISRLRRDAVARLCLAQANGRLSVEAFQERYVLLTEAETPSAIRAIAAAFEDESGGYAAVPAEEFEAPLPADREPPVRLPAILGSLVRAGDWNVAEETDLLVILGEAKLDLREASIPFDTIVINVRVTLGSLEVIVPPGTRVENDTTMVLSSASHKRPRKRTALPNGLMVIIQGRAVLGDITIREKPLEAPKTLIERMGLG